MLYALIGYEKKAHNNDCISKRTSPSTSLKNGPKEIRIFQEKLIEIDRILDSGIEHDFIVNKIQDYRIYSHKVLQKQYSGIRIALRFALLLCLTGDSSRELAFRVSDSPLLQWFTTLLENPASLFAK